MLDAIDVLRRAGMQVAALTNNWVPFAGIDEHAVRGRFDVFVESHREGVNKPDPRIYQTLVDRIGIPADRVVYLDDIGRNLKPGRDLGMTTIRVDDPLSALRRLGDLVGLRLV
jgi:putative hydrolase of the HAD superfamily